MIRKAPRIETENAQSDQQSRAIETWTVEELSDWLLLGFERWAWPLPGQSKLTAFRPVDLGSKDLTYQLEYLAKASPELNVKLYNALDLCFSRWDDKWTPEALGLAFDLASRIGAKFVQDHGLRLVRDAQVLELEPSRRATLLAQMVNALAGSEWNKSSDEFVRELHLRDLWQPEYAGNVVLGRIKADPDRWLDITMDAGPDLTRADSYEPEIRALILERIVRTASLPRVLHDLPQAWVRGEEWLIRGLLTGKDPVLTVLDREVVCCAELSAFWDYRDIAKLVYPDEPPDIWDCALKFYGTIKDALAAWPAKVAEPLFTDIAATQVLYWSCSTPEDRLESLRETKAQEAQTPWRWGKGSKRTDLQSTAEEAIMQRGLRPGLKPAEVRRPIRPWEAKMIGSVYVLQTGQTSHLIVASTPKAKP